MITLTTPIVVPTVIGGVASVAYDKMHVNLLKFDTEALKITGNAKLKSSTSPNATPLDGTLSIAAGIVDLSVQFSGRFVRVVLGAGGITAANAIITNAQNALESGLISVGAVDGIQTPGV